MGRNRVNSIVIETDKLSKSFGTFKAVDNVSFRVGQGSIFGLLGANGAGKSTLIRMLCGLLSTSSGTGKVAGFDINKEPESIKRKIGYMSQKFSLYNDLTVHENIEFFGGVYGLTKAHIKERAAWVVKMAGLEGREEDLTHNLSGGWKQRLALGCAVIHNPQILFLDEPTGGVDPVSRKMFWDLINELASGGTTILVTTHYLDEAEYCNRIMLMHGGQKIAIGSPGELKSEHIKETLLEITCSDCSRASEILINRDWVLDSSLFGTRIHVLVRDETDAIINIKKILPEAGIDLTSVEKTNPSLEDVFIRLIEEKSKKE
ncbi:MAG: ABC transporter ATP-binding protein [Spirochaetales bacterium]|nr:ABC transporter ATP-binding protein [Spirochaetales bacterium]